jgi:hypothetical protein
LKLEATKKCKHSTLTTNPEFVKLLPRCDFAPIWHQQFFNNTSLWSIQGQGGLQKTVQSIVRITKRRLFSSLSSLFGVIAEKYNQKVATPH